VPSFLAYVLGKEKDSKISASLKLEAGAEKFTHFKRLTP
jgi:hypothetical protein